MTAPNTSAVILSLRKKSKRFFFQFGAICIGIVLVFPILYALFISVMPANQILSNPPSIFPKTVIWDNYVVAVTKTLLFRYMWNSLVLAGISSVVRVLTASLAAYSFTFFRFPGKNVLFMACLGTMMIPSDIVLVANYSTVSRLGLINTYLGVMIVFFVSAVNIFVMRQHFLGFSKSLKEAAYIDGCGNFRFYASILMPTSVPVITTVFISAFIGTWNTYLWPLMVTNSNSMRTVQVGITMLNFPDGSVYGPIMAASILVIIPTIIIFVSFQKKIVEGMMSGAVKE